MDTWGVPDDADEIEPPFDDDLIDDWQQSTPETYAEILEAKDSDRTLAGGIAAAILLGSWLFDRASSTYLKPGRRRTPLSQDELEQILKTRVEVSKRAIDKISVAYANGQIDSEEWGDRAAAEALTLHSQAFVLGRGGLEQMEDSDRALLSKILTFHQYKLSEFQDALENLSQLQAMNRLRLYVSSATGSFWAGYEQAQIAAGFTHSQRRLGAAESCEDCRRYEAMGRREIGLLPVPGVACACGGNCRCRIEYS
jgi:hypothetical protein